jgi:hypothetical protein
VCLRTAVHHHSWRKAKQKTVDAVGDRQRIAMVVQIPNYTELATSGGVVRPKKKREAGARDVSLDTMDIPVVE